MYSSTLILFFIQSVFIEDYSLSLSGSSLGTGKYGVHQDLRLGI